MDAQQETMQSVNRTIREFAADPRVPPDDVWEFFCECGCFTLVQLTLAEFEEGDAVLALGHTLRAVGSPEPGIPSA